MLSDVEIKKYLDDNSIRIFSSCEGMPAFNISRQVQSASIDLRFRSDYRRFKTEDAIKLSKESLSRQDYTAIHHLEDKQNLVIKPGEIILATTIETVILGNEFAGFITGRSSFARLGIMVQCCQDFINPGHAQPVPLQLINLSPCEVELSMIEPICQLVIFKLNQPTENPYSEKVGAKYANETAPQESKIHAIQSDGEQEKEHQQRIKKRTKNRFFNSYIKPLLPPVVVAVIVIPLLNGISAISMPDLIVSITASRFLQVSVIIGVIVLFIISQRSESK